MLPLYHLRDFQNIFSFALRSRVRFKKVPKTSDLNNPALKKLQVEFRDFLNLFDWEFIKDRPSLTMVDIGCRDFSFAPVLEEKFLRPAFLQSAIHGVEIDAFRRYVNLCSRADYGRAFAAQIKNGFYHAQDFLHWRQDADIAFLLHPFVTPEPPVRWGLPLRKYDPEALFAHCFGVLQQKKGFLLLSNPTIKEFEISNGLAKKVGFTLVEEATWDPNAQSAHQKPRFGALLTV